MSWQLALGLCAALPLEGFELPFPLVYGDPLFKEKGKGSVCGLGGCEQACANKHTTIKVHYNNLIMLYCEHALLHLQQKVEFVCECVT